MPPQAKAAWRSFCRSVSRELLGLLRDALKQHSHELVRCVTAWPRGSPNAEPQGACPIGWLAWKGSGCRTVAEVEDAFALLAFQADLRLGGCSRCRWFLAWFDTIDCQVSFPLLVEDLNDYLDESSRSEVI